MPIIVSTWSFSARGNSAAWQRLALGGTSLDAVELCCQVVDAAPDVDSVGFGGLPDASGRVSLDGCIMLSPARCGSACVLRRHLHPVSVARRVMERTTHVMLAGSDADEFADREGFAAAELLSPDARQAWERWRAKPTEVDQSRDQRLTGLRPVDGGATSDGRLFLGRETTGEARWKHHDTIGTLCLDASGTLAGACSTSGTPFKVPGRVGDSPIIGHGLYVDPSAGAATATGAGELIMGVCGSFLAVECLRHGKSPLEAAVTVIDRIRGAYELRPHHQVAMIVMRPDGAWAAAALRQGFLAAVRNDQGEQLVAPDAVLIPDDRAGDN
ncbi:MAG: isoaspartyl peptidase/L-asparaginase [Phycisphaerae bacterium]|nr:isoaspartyl peptidase/L-asparaginase [Phycisphaerae bacterium]